MRIITCKTGISAVAVMLVLGGCGSNGASTEEASNPSVDPNVAFTQYDQAAKPFECSKAYGEMYDGYADKHYGIMKDRARQHRDVVAAFDAQLSKTAFPVAAQPIVDTMRGHIATELTGLNELMSIDDKDTERMSTLIVQVQADDSAATVEGDRLREALGHPETQAGTAADQVDLAYLTFYKDIDPVSAKFDAALAANDLDGAKAANGIEIDALQRYIDALDAIKFPPGTFQAQANTLREHLLGLIEFDRRQVDVPTAAHIVRTTEQGVADQRGAEAAHNELWTALNQAYIAEQPGRCS